jgi:chromosome segregation ATPase
VHSHLENVVKELTDSNDAYQFAQQQQRLVHENLNRTQGDIKRQEDILHQLAEQQQDSLKVYGSSMPNILRDIARETRWKHRPIGPLGLHIKLLQPEWAKTLEAVIGKLLCAFAVQTHSDRQLLTAIARKYRW